MKIKSYSISLLALLFLLPMDASGEDAPDGAGRTVPKIYNENAKTQYSENDVKAFVYEWFAGFDHQADIAFFKKHLDPQRIDMSFSGQTIKSFEDFERWYENVLDTIQWNAHTLSDLEVSGNERDGFSVSFNVRWVAKSYVRENYDMSIHQEWRVVAGADKNFVIVKHEAKVINK